MAWLPSVRSNVPLVVTVVVIPAAVTLSMYVPSAVERYCRHAAIVPDTANDKAFTEELLSKFVMSSLLEKPLSLVGSRSIPVGVRVTAGLLKSIFQSS